MVVTEVAWAFPADYDPCAYPDATRNEYNGDRLRAAAEILWLVDCARVSQLDGARPIEEGWRDVMILALRRQLDDALRDIEPTSPRTRLYVRCLEIVGAIQAERSASRRVESGQ